MVAIESDLLDVDDLDRSWSLSTTIAPSGSHRSCLSSQTRLSVDGELPKKVETTPTSASNRTSITSTNPASSVLSLPSSSQSHEASSRPPSSGLQLSQRNGSQPRLGNVPPPPGPANDFGFYRWSNAWNAFMRYDPKTFAVELTRSQWQRFVMIRVSCKHPYLCSDGEFEADARASRCVPARLWK
jgi:hypothetical protein